MMEQTGYTIVFHGFIPKRQHINDLVDRISDLPDSILSAILSLLPTKEAVSTVFLSKRWKFVWRTVLNLDFNRDYKETDKKFVEFVNGVLHHHDSALLNRFSLSWTSSSRTESWIMTAIKKNVHELSLCGIQPNRLPRSVFRCESLKSLKLTRIHYTFVSDAFVFCLPRLETLEIEQVDFESEATCEKLIRGCPVLTYMYLLIVNKDLNGLISSASLRRLKIGFSYNNSLKLNTPSLEYFGLYGRIFGIFVEKNLGYLVEAHIDVLWVDDDVSYDSIAEAIRAFDNAKVLTLSDSAFRVLECATIDLSTTFKKLVKLEAYACRSLLDCRTLQDFIWNSDNLEVLTIHQGVDERRDHHLKWNTRVEVPRCLSNRLKEVVIDYRTCPEDDCEMIKFMLEHGSALEVVEIYCDEHISKVAEKMFKMAQKILEFPRKSPSCIVRIVE